MVLKSVGELFISFEGTSRGTVFVTHHVIKQDTLYADVMKANAEYVFYGKNWNVWCEVKCSNISRKRALAVCGNYIKNYIDNRTP